MVQMAEKPPSASMVRMYQAGDRKKGEDPHGNRGEEDRVAEGGSVGEDNMFWREDGKICRPDRHSSSTREGAHVGVREPRGNGTRQPGVDLNDSRYFHRSKG
uniref:Uncharacterized protein n=1 Tax=Octactis speculum TaxID=3111310 RepID=A0A7S2GFP1_9STRA